MPYRRRASQMRRSLAVTLPVFDQRHVQTAPPDLPTHDTGFRISRPDAGRQGRRAPDSVGLPLVRRLLSSPGVKPREIAIRTVLIVAALATVATSEPRDSSYPDEPRDPVDAAPGPSTLTAAAEGTVAAPTPRHVSVLLDRSAAEEADEIQIEFRWPPGEIHDVITIDPDGDLETLTLVTDDPVQLEASSTCSAGGPCAIGFTVDAYYEEPGPTVARITATARVTRFAGDFSPGADVVVVFDDD